jgi:hypothetical protein
MSLIRRLFTILRPPRARYGDDVLLAGWVQVPAAFLKRN